MSDINDKSRVPIGWLAAAASLGVLAGSAHWRLQSMDEDYGKHKEVDNQRYNELKDLSHVLEIKQVTVEGDIRRMATSIESIDRKLDSITVVKAKGER